MSNVEPEAARRFAFEVVSRLRRAGYRALWAGGCVRDRLLGLVPKDYDVATDATPEQIRAVLGRRRTIAVGAAFGVITVVGPKEAGQVEVATFREETTYSDGRHPDSVSFTDARQDALRRDFTINGLFWDPVDERVIDYVEGQADLAAGVIRAIGDPHRRIAEDKLRMMRAVRFAAVFGFRVEAATLSAIVEHASEISVVSAERISDELRRMLPHPSRRLAAELLRKTGLLAAVIPELDSDLEIDGTLPGWQRTLDVLDALETPAFATALAALLRPTVGSGPQTVNSICRRLKLAKVELELTQFCLQHEELICHALDVSWADLQPVLVDGQAQQLLVYAAAVAKALDLSPDSVAFCDRQLRLPPEQLNPAPLITGHDLQLAEIPPGPAYRVILQEVRNAQLLGNVEDRESALRLAERLWDELQA